MARPVPARRCSAPSLVTSPGPWGFLMVLRSRDGRWHIVCREGSATRWGGRCWRRRAGGVPQPMARFHCGDAAVHLDAHGLTPPACCPAAHATAAFLTFPATISTLLRRPRRRSRQVPDGQASTEPRIWSRCPADSGGGQAVAHGRQRAAGTSQRRRTGSPARPTTQAEWLEALGLDIVDVDRNGDCLYASFLVIAGRYMLDHELMRDHRRAEPELRGWLDGGSAGEPPRSAVLALRRWVADRLAADFAAARAVCCRGTGSRTTRRLSRTATPAVVG